MNQCLKFVDVVTFACQKTVATKVGKSNTTQSKD